MTRFRYDKGTTLALVHVKVSLIFEMHSWTPIISPADGLDGLFFKDVL